MKFGKELYEGKAKIVYEGTAPNEIFIYYKDDATAFNAQKKGTIVNKGIMNAAISSAIFRYLAQNGVPTHLIETIDERTQRCHRVSIIPLEVIARNILAGSTARLLGIAEGKVLDTPIYEICYKNDALGDPLINDCHAISLGLASREELQTIYSLTAKINGLLKTFFAKHGITLVDFKIEFGRTEGGEIVLADEISPDSCRLWDSKTGEKMDKDRFRRDLGNIEEAYQEVLKRIAQG